MTAVTAHLWSSTLVLVAALAAARLLPLTARTRYALLVCALVKFALPSAPFTMLLDRAGVAAPGTISMQWLGGPPALGTLAPHPASHWPEMLIAAWIGGAAILALAWLVARRRLVSSAFASSSPASPREHAALAAARRGLGMRAAIDVVRSPLCEAPAVVRIIRPVVVLPGGGCDALDDAELESLLRHECAHVVRRDNLLGVLESALVAAFWFHPLIWLAQRAIATAREEARDEIAAATAASIDTYLSALTKVCRAVLAPRLAGVSCMASAHLKERLRHLMTYEDLRPRALSHRFVVALAAFAVVAVTAGSALRASSPSPQGNDPYKLSVVVRPGTQPDHLAFHGRVIEVATGRILASPDIDFKRGGTARHTSGTNADGDDREFIVEIRDLGSRVSAELRVVFNGVEQQRSSVVAEVQEPRSNKGGYSGAPISMNLKDAEIKEVLSRFATVTGMEITYPPALQGRVTIDVTNMPWDQAFEQILHDQNLKYEVKGNSILVKQ